MAVTDVGVAAGGLGKTVAAAIVQFNKAAVTPKTITMVPALAGSNTVQIPVYSKMAASAVTNSAAGAEETTGSAASITSAAVNILSCFLSQALIFPLLTFDTNSVGS